MQDRQIELKLSGVLNQWADEGNLPAGVTWQIPRLGCSNTARASWQESKLPALAMSFIASTVLLCSVFLMTMDKNITYASASVVTENGAVVVNPSSVSGDTKYTTLVEPSAPAKNEVPTELVSGDIECQVYVDAKGNFMGSLCQKDHAANQTDSATVFVAAAN